MQFLYPTFLWALAVLSIPVIIHLFHFRRFKKVYFTNVRLLKELKEETSTRNKLRSLLILLARCLAIAMLVFAFAQPIIKSGDVADVRMRAIELFVDNSFSMEAQNSEVPLFTQAKDRAREIIASYDERDVFLILTHDLEPKHQRFVDQKTALGFVDELTVSPNVERLEDVAAVISRIRRTVTDHDHQLYFLSDFQENISGFNTPIDTSVTVQLIPFRAIQESNVGLLSAEWEAPIAMKDQPNRMIVRLYNYGDEPQAVELRMNYEGQQRPLGSVSIPPESEGTDTINVAITRTGWHQMELLIDDYPVEFDNQLFLSFNIKDQIDVTSIYDQSQNDYLKSAFESIAYYNLNQVSKNSIRYEAFQNQELIILDDLSDISSGLSNELVKYVSNGGNLLIFPSMNANVSAYNNLLALLRVDRLGEIETGKKDVSYINMDQFVFSNVYETARRNVRMPSSARNYTIISSQRTGKEVLLRYRDGAPYLQKFALEKGNIYLCSSAMDHNSNDLVRNAEVFVPMLYKMALSTGVRTPLSYSIGEDDVIALSSLAGATGERYLISGDSEFIPGVSATGQMGFIDVRGQITQSGFYDLTLEGNLIETLSFNYDRQESDVSYGNIGTVAQQISPNAQVLTDVALADLSGYISEKQDGIRLWRWCLILSLLFLLIEIALIRFWK